MSLGIAIGETCIQFSGLEDCCVDFWIWVFDRTKDCCACFCECIIPAENGCCAFFTGWVLGNLCEFGTLANSWIFYAVFIHWREIGALLPINIVGSVLVGLSIMTVPVVLCTRDPKDLYCFKCSIGWWRLLTTIWAIMLAVFWLPWDYDRRQYPNAPYISWFVVVLKIWCDVIMIFRAGGGA